VLTDNNIILKSVQEVPSPGCRIRFLCLSGITTKERPKKRGRHTAASITYLKAFNKIVEVFIKNLSRCAAQETATSVSRGGMRPWY